MGDDTSEAAGNRSRSFCVRVEYPITAYRAGAIEALSPEEATGGGAGVDKRPRDLAGPARPW